MTLTLLEEKGPKPHAMSEGVGEAGVDGGGRGPEAAPGGEDGKPSEPREPWQSRYERLRGQILDGTAGDEEVRRELARAELLRVIEAATAGSTPWWRRSARAVRRPINAAALAAAAVVLVVAACTVLRSNEVGVQIDAVASTVSFVAEDEVVLTPYLSARNLRVEGLGSIEVPRPDVAMTAQAASAAEVESKGAVRLDKIVVPRGHRITVEQEDGLRISVAPENTAGHFPASTATVSWRQPHVREGGELVETLYVEVPPPGGIGSPSELLLAPDEGTGESTARVTAHSAPGGELRVRFRSDSGSVAEPVAWKLDSLAGASASGLRFVLDERRPSGAIRPVSSLTGAKVSYPSLRREPERTTAHEHLSADHSHGLILSMGVADDGIRLVWQGTVSGLRAGHPQHVRSMMPGRLEKLFRSKQWAYMSNVGSVVFLLVMLLLRRTPPSGVVRMVASGGIDPGGDE